MLTFDLIYEMCILPATDEDKAKEKEKEEEESSPKKSTSLTPTTSTTITRRRPRERRRATGVINLDEEVKEPTGECGILKNLTSGGDLLIKFQTLDLWV